MATGNVGRPEALVILERDLWSLIFQIALGASVHQILPVYIRRWAGSINSDEVAAARTWLDDFSLGGELSLSMCVGLSFMSLIVFSRGCWRGPHRRVRLRR